MKDIIESLAPTLCDYQYMGSAKDTYPRPRDGQNAGIQHLRSFRTGTSCLRAYLLLREPRICRIPCLSRAWKPPIFFLVPLRLDDTFVWLAGDGMILVDDRTDRAELQDQIAQLLIESSFPLDEFLNLKEETIVNKDDDIFAAVVECYSINKPGKEDESNDEKEKVERIEDAEALRIVERLKLWKLQRGTDQDIRALDRIEREIVGVRSSTDHQTTVLRFLKPK
jgi:hypothetical protein